MTFAENAYECVTGASAVAVVTEWNEFRALDLKRVEQLLASPVFIDLRNIYSAAEVEKYGLRYTSVGRPDRAKKRLRA